MLGSGGAVYAFGDAVHLGAPTLPDGVNAVELEPTPSANGYWIVHAVGDAPHLGDVDRRVLAAGEKITSVGHPVRRRLLDLHHPGPGAPLWRRPVPRRHVGGGAEWSCARLDPHPIGPRLRHGRLRRRHLRLRRRPLHRIDGRPPPQRPSAVSRARQRPIRPTGSSPPSAGSSPSTRHSGAPWAASRSTSRSGEWSATATATSWWPATAASSLSPTNPSPAASAPPHPIVSVGFGNENPRTLNVSGP